MRNEGGFLLTTQPGKKPNRLANEKSPYLLQHAYNPVDWYLWGNEAFTKAKEEDKPIFLSIGYSTCHWCHVMERESFEDPEVAELLNKYFVSIKVDREERPDIDSIYMNVCQMLTGQGGWPLNVFLTPDQKPFYAGTYFPKESMYGRPGMIDIIPHLYKEYRTNPEKIAETAEQITAGLKEQTAVNEEKALDRDVIHRAYQQIAGQFDEEFGGFGAEPKFPMPHQLMFLLSYHSWSGEEKAYEMAAKTMHAMADGGIRDHIGGGFARYSTDRYWLVPHFEKMLYDNALLLYVISSLYQVDREPGWKSLAEEMFSFIQREMTGEQGEFYSAIDADSEGVEGKYYVWPYDEVLDILGEERGELFCEIFDLSEEGNFEGKNIPHLIHTELEAVARLYGYSDEDVHQFIHESKRALLDAREKRTYPHLDDKVLTSWNALMIAALAKAGAVFGESKYVHAAQKAMRFMEDHLWKEDKLYARYREGDVKYPAYLDDYAFLLWGCIELFEAGQNPAYLEKAQKLSDAMFAEFWDGENGGFYFTAKSGESLIVREKPLFDQAMPSGNSVAAFQLWRLAKITGDEQLQKRLDQLFAAFSGDIRRFPSGPVYMLQALMAKFDGGSEVFVSGEDPDKRKAYLQHFFSKHKPFDVIAEIPPAQKAPFEAWEEKRISGKPFALFVCRQHACQRPVYSLDEALEME
jgi:hypothetical protein